MDRRLAPILLYVFTHRIDITRDRFMVGRYVIDAESHRSVPEVPGTTVDLVNGKALYFADQLRRQP